jgi:NAD(P)H dehydrogenase (quinone)
MRVIDAAKSAGVRSLAYTSVLRADTSSLALAREHKLTEEAIRASGVPFVFLRNGWYFENHTEQLRPAIEHGAILGAAGDGRFASATREDYAAAAAAALTEKEQGNRIYELAGDEPFTLSELAAEVSRQAGKPVVYKNLAPAQYAQVLASAGLPPVMVDLIVDSDLGASRGDLDGSSADMRRLIGRPTTRLADAVVAALGTRK